jgi:hypothetical protein
MKKLEDLFNLPEREDNKLVDENIGESESDENEIDPLNEDHYIVVDEVDEDTVIRVPDAFQSRKGMSTKIDHIDKISAALPFVGDLGNKADRELDEIYDKAMGSYNDLMDFAMGIEPRYSGRILEVANSMLKTSLDAKVAKMNKKLKMVELQLKHERALNVTPQGGSTVSGEGEIVADRNSLIDQLKNMQKKDK